MQWKGKNSVLAWNYILIQNMIVQKSVQWGPQQGRLKAVAGE